MSPVPDKLVKKSIQQKAVLLAILEKDGQIRKPALEIRFLVLLSGRNPKMNHIYIPTSSPDDWRKFLAEPEKQWRSGHSAKELAECWEQSNGFPPEFQKLFSESENQALRELELLLAIPEYQVDLPGGRRPSQNDLFVLARAKNGQLVTITVEGKVAEPFGDTLETWLKGASEGKQTRLKFLCDVLELSVAPPSHIRYQLFHRTASAIIEARRFNAKYAMMIVHSFSPEHKWLADYQDFLSLFGATGEVNELVKLSHPKSISLYAGWVAGNPKPGPAPLGAP
jgi:hypothetical protein